MSRLFPLNGHHQSTDGRPDEDRSNFGNRLDRGALTQPRKVRSPQRGTLSRAPLSTSAAADAASVIDGRRIDNKLGHRQATRTTSLDLRLWTGQVVDVVALTWS